MQTDSLEARVKELVAGRMAVRADQLSARTRLLEDIGADGADGWEFMAAFGKRFEVDMSEFRADRHFGPEGVVDPVRLLVELIFPSRRTRYIPITIGDLVAAARSGRWSAPTREPV